MAGKEESADHSRMVDSEYLTQAIIECAVEGIITIDTQGIVHSFNSAAEHIFGYRREEAIGRNVSFLMPSPHRDWHDDYINRYLTSGKPRVIGTGRTVSGLRKDGSELHIRLSVAEYEAHGHTMFVGFTHDMTELKRAKMEARDHLEKLAHLNRVNAMGELASGLAHEIRQPLMAIQAHATAARQSIDAGSSSEAQLDDTLNEISRQSVHANGVIEQMRAFLKKGQPRERETVDISSIAGNVLSLLSHEVRSADIRFELNTARAPCLCPVNRIQIEQVLYNLISNAIDSLRESGGNKKLSLSCERQEAGHQCAITVRDNGTGIAEAHREELWDPFFTTKTHGIGQGLAICRSIVNDHGGELSAENAPEGGAIFRFTLPLAREGV